MKINIPFILSAILGLLLIIFGLNKFLAFIPVQPPEDPTAQNFLSTMFTSYLYFLVATAEIIGGFLLIFRRTRILGWLLVLPVLVNIILFHLAHDFIGNGIWLLPMVLFIALSIVEKQRLQHILKV